ncbi:hypothetical protein AB833_23945 [Chromatiales bacterium (ex Bugula neritina AB1)]|nr:hypothetical protein AB833_23945 [Chromatiales bacterium (ex Bugula neritina AB1)]
MRFYDCATAPSPRRVRIFIAEKEITIPVEEVDLASRQQHNDSFIKVNPHRTVPVLELDDGSVLTSTQGIWHYLEYCYPSKPLMGRNAAERGRVIDLEWRVEQEGFMAVGESFRNKSKAFKRHAFTGGQEYGQIPELIERGKLRTGHFFSWLDQLLGDRKFLAGDFFSIADITALVTIDFARWIKCEIPDDHTALKNWYAEVSRRPSSCV